MATTSERLAFDRGVRPMLEIVLPEKADAVIGFRADPELQAGIEELSLVDPDDFGVLAHEPDQLGSRGETVTQNRLDDVEVAVGDHAT